METVYLKGTPCHTYGSLPEIGSKAPCYTLVDKDLKDISCLDFLDRRVVLNIFPSIDTDVCAASVRRFNKEAAGLPDTVVLCVSMDLPFASARFCEANDIKDVIAASAFRSPMFAENYGLQMVDGPLAGLLARAVIVIDGDRNIVYTDLVSEITEEPKYEEALEVLRQ